jgi:hypothetical protein
MLKYVVRINLNKEKYAEWLKNGKDYDKHNPIKGWDGVAPLYGAGKCYSLRLTTKLEMAMQYNKEEDAYNYAYNCTDDCYACNFPPILNAEVVAIEFEPKEIGVTRVYVPKKQRH